MIDVKKVGELARLHIQPEDEAKYQSQLSAIFKYFEDVAKIDTNGIEPLVTPSEIEQVWRADEKKIELTTEEALANAPEKSGQLFRVPPVV
jgi:aspartyl-tRNA(Asn)/glutamyl-tRNA(Gln) amidotransferase subunit C